MAAAALAYAAVVGGLLLVSLASWARIALLQQRFEYARLSAFERRRVSDDIRSYRDMATACLYWGLALGVLGIWLYPYIVAIIEALQK